MSDGFEVVKARIEECGAKYATVAFVDLQGQLRGKTVSVQKLLSGYPNGLPFVPFMLALDLGDSVLFPSGYLKPGGGLGDNAGDIDWERPRTVPFEHADSNLFFFNQFADGTQGSGWDPRRLYGAIEARAKSLGLTPVYGNEYEYRLLRESPDSLRKKHFTNLNLVDDASSTMGIMHQSVWSEFLAEMRSVCERLDIGVSGMHWEFASALGEIALLHQTGITALDDAVLFKTYAKVLARRHDLTLTFMAKPFEAGEGQSGHVHFSLLDEARKNVFYDPGKEHSMSDLQRFFVGGVQHLLPDLLLMMAPNINSFKRFVPAKHAPTASDWGVENRTTALRVISGSEKSQRIELRAPGSDSNPYLVAACLLAAGLEGIERKLAPSQPVERASHLTKDVPEALRFPATFEAAIERFHGSADARRLFGDDFVEIYAGTRRAQSEQFAKMVTNRDLERFLELA